jgi:cation diffusion facilitator CzcD-associated flavoprotein CzcO
MQSEIQAYFRNVAEQYCVIEHIRFQTVVEKAEWDDNDKVWIVSILDLKTKERGVRRAKILVSGVGSLSVPRKCDLPGTEKFRGKMFHSAEWDHSFNWEGKDVVIIGTSPLHPLIRYPF